MGVLQDLLAAIDVKKRRLGRNLSDLVNDPMGYLEMTADRTPETVKEYVDDPMNFVGGGVGKIAWHGSPHKFDKFSLDKIGTGEGAQAYGHGLYLAESKDVADSYSSIGKVLHNIGEASFDGVPASRLPWLKDNTPEELALRVIGTEKSVDKGARVLERLAKSDKDYAAAKQFFDANKSRIDWQSARPEMESATPNLYKTDIPDEAVSRFLDWDKPLSQQAPEVQAAIRPMLDKIYGNGSAFNASGLGEAAKDYLMAKSGSSGSDVIRNLARSSGDDAATRMLREAGIPGIRYLDGGSRSAGQGSSNFVIFDPEMIRILERNGQPTGLKPWQTGEYQLSDLLR